MMTRSRHPSSDASVSARSLLLHADQYLKALRILVHADAGGPILVIGHVAAHALELTFKGYLLHKGMTENEFIRRDGVGHDLERAWEECEVRGLVLVAEKSWMHTLNQQHNRPHLYRYGRDGWGQGIPGDPNSLLSYVENVMRQVAAALGDGAPK